MEPRSEFERELETKWNACDAHDWRETSEIIEGDPPQNTYYCPKCRAFTHDKSTGEYCFVVHYI